MSAFGLTDFFIFGGIPFGQGQAVPPPPTGHGFRGAGRYAHMWLATEQGYRQRREQRQHLPVLRQQVWRELLHQGMARQRQQRQRRIEESMYSVVLAEL